jgi:diguanylate cyclase (GGDEF)-like protein
MGVFTDLEAIADGPAKSERVSANREIRRDRTASLRDATATSRDLVADQRDRAAEGEEEALLLVEDTRESTIRALLSAAHVLRGLAAADRASASSDREHAAADRVDAARDRDHAADDRACASADSSHARIELKRAHLDSLTGAHRRDLGRAVLQREIERSRRSGEPFALAFVDVDGLKQLNDRDGHAAGDTLLQTVAVALNAGLRSGDPVVRHGGDEFLCGFTNTNLEASRRRVDQIRTGLADGSPSASVSIGIATLGERDTLEMLIARADADMYSKKERITPPLSLGVRH